MSEPEIARRCQSCGASIRDLAFFCPQCGKELKTTGELTKRAPDQDSTSTAVATAPLDDAPQRKEQLDAPKPEQPKSPEQPASRNPPGQTRATPAPPARAKATPGAHGSAEARGKVQRATGLARNVGGDVIQRGQKLREMSGAVLDEASYDASLRFVLVAAALFLLFLVIVLLNRFIV